ncbi:large ribosomal subunit protein uL4m [Lepeophtheirus salmonis]|uniref:Large ribosomal subunit protein uL4m n=2 Tax=Lepeophtheirus salmonis TaxID=72036 RepID=C1BS34_LEPSM|nr:39S ribosomal protein L4, mitochondrial-like [Lepeophtheirus salmonis]ACO11837.1 Mitochondrial 39S ribosomal protein L4 [Lepeophtheirus salmonis]ADD38874.1 39S ribosomal protein L4, mitochondrial [Lepeophtheirus salmonis]
MMLFSHRLIHQTRRLLSSLSREAIFEKYPVVESKGVVPRQCWIESLKRSSSTGSAGQIVDLHPDVWGVAPRLDIIADNLKWQENYKKVEYNYVKDRYELPGKGARPWPQKGTGRARHKSKRSPIWLQGGKAHGPKGPKTNFFMLPYQHRVNGLIHTLSVKFAQDDIIIVQNFDDLESTDPEDLEDLISERGWGLSTLFVNGDSIAPENITAASESILHVNVMPSFGLNVHSMLKHKTLVLTLDAVNLIEDKLLFAQRRSDAYSISLKNKKPTSML